MEISNIFNSRAPLPPACNASDYFSRVFNGRKFEGNIELNGRKSEEMEGKNKEILFFKSGSTGESFEKFYRRRKIIRPVNKISSRKSMFI